MADRHMKIMTIKEIEIKVIVRYDIVFLRLRGKKTTLNIDKLTKDIRNRKSCIILEGI